MGLVCGLIGLVLALTIYFIPFALLFGTTAVILGVLGRRRAADAAVSGGLSTAGLVIGLVSLAWSYFWLWAIILGLVEY